MKSLTIAVALVATGFPANSQIQYLRYDDNFSYLKRDSARKTGIQKLKYIALPGRANLSFGGEIREQLQYYKNINFGDVPSTFEKSRTGQLWHRLMAHANIEAGKNTRLFIQAGSTYRFINPNPLTPEIEQNELGLHQAFIDHHFSNKWMTRVGRQEMSYGSHRLVTFREGPNTRLTFDAAVIRFNNGKRRLDVLALSPVVSRIGVFDDEKFKDFIVGVYVTEKSKAFNFDYYFLNFTSKRRVYNFTGGRENRKIAGFRIFSEDHLTKYEMEGTYQFGKFNELSINAYSLSADINRILLPKYNFLIGLAATYISGDKNKSDRKLNTYNLLFSKPQFGLTAPIGATNIITVNLYIKLKPVKKASLVAGTHFMWRQSDQDGTYTPGGTQLRPTTEMGSTSVKNEIGALAVLESTYKVDKHLSFAIDASRFFAGNYTRETGKGKDITYLSCKISFKF